MEPKYGRPGGSLLDYCGIVEVEGASAGQIKSILQMGCARAAFSGPFCRSGSCVPPMLPPWNLYMHPRKSVTCYVHT